MAKQKERTDILALAEKLTGIHYMEIIHAAYEGVEIDFQDVLQQIYSYECSGIIYPRIRYFSAFLVLDWKKKHGDFTRVENRKEEG
ncbi:MAG: hypothetical protein NTZ13_01145 [Candidatus Parcubacteria bacterium]|nr:hypothetical protein [Candidatus Parcubacteria bacterium]